MKLKYIGVIYLEAGDFQDAATKEKLITDTLHQLKNEQDGIIDVEFSMHERRDRSPKSTPNSEQSSKAGKGSGKFKGSSKATTGAQKPATTPSS